MTIPPNPHPEQGEAVAATLVTVERAEHGLPPCRFDMLTQEDQRRYRERATAVLASLANRPADDGGWIVGNNVGQWRTFDSFGWAWTDRRDLAVRYARRQDAEMVHGEDENAWRVEPFAPPQPDGVKRP